MNADIAAAQRIARLTPLADVLSSLARAQPVAARDMAVAEARGCVLAADAMAAAAQPPAALTARDGWAVDADATRDSGPYAPMVLQPFTQRIDAFAPLPPDTDAVAPIDAVSIMGGMMQIMSPVTPGEGVLPKAFDAEAGIVLRKAGTRLRAIDVAALSTAGVSHVSIRAPRIHIAITRQDDAILQSVARFLQEAIDDFGAKASVGNDLDAALRDESIDAALGIGGTGSGRTDQAVTTLSRAGALTCHGIGLLPGETAAFGFAGKRPVLLIPGRVDAALACWLVLVRPLLAQLSGAVEGDSVFSVPLSRKITSTIGMAEVVPVRNDGDTITPLASGMLPLQALTQADGWILVPADSEGYPAGTLIQVRPLP